MFNLVNYEEHYSLVVVAFLAWRDVIITVIIISTELLALCDRCLGWGWVWRVGFVAGLQVGRLLGCSCYLGLGSAAPAPRLLGTQPPHATQALI